MVSKKYRIWGNLKYLWVGRGKGKRLFRRLGFCAVPRGFKNMERKDPEREPA